MYKRFNDLALEFLTRMEETFPQEPKIQSYRIKFDLVMCVDSRKPVEMFIENMEPFGEQILSKDELFFKQQHSAINNAESISGKMGLVKYWDSMPVKTKDAIWEYMQGLYLLGMGTLDKKEELKKIINKTNYVA